MAAHRIGVSGLGGLLRKKRAYVFWPFRLVHQRGVAQTVLVIHIILCRAWGGHVGYFHNGTPRLLTPKKTHADSDSLFGFGAVGFVVEDWAVEEMRAKKD